MSPARKWWANGHFYYTTARGGYYMLENCEVETVREYKAKGAHDQIRWFWGDVAEKVDALSGAHNKVPATG